MRVMFKYPLSGPDINIHGLVYDDEDKRAIATVIKLRLTGWDKPRKVVYADHLYLYVETQHPDNGRVAGITRDDCLIDRYFYVCPTGAELPPKAHDYIDTVLTPAGYVFHVFEGPERIPPANIRGS